MIKEPPIRYFAAAPSADSAKDEAWLRQHTLRSVEQAQRRDLRYQPRPNVERYSFFGLRSSRSATLLRLLARTMAITGEPRLVSERLEQQRSSEITSRGLQK